MPVRPIVIALLLVMHPAAARGQDFARGRIVDPVACADEAAQTYALYLPSTYSADRMWSVLLAFHPMARGRSMVEVYQDAAERYGVIVAGSNNARNGPHAVSAAAAQAMATDVSRRFSIDPKRVYLTGMSGGARVALSIALANDSIAGVIASSAGYPDSQPRERVAFPIFGTAGTEDFNYLELRQLDRALTSPHFLSVFVGGHTLPPADVATTAVEWMELQAMHSQRRQRDDALVARLLERRRAAIARSTGLTDTIYLLRALVADFRGLADVSAEATRLEEMSRQPDVKKALKRERERDDAEARAMREVLQFEAQLRDDGSRTVALLSLRERLARLSRAAGSDSDTPERRQARRLLRSIAAGASVRVQDLEYLAVVEQYRLSGRP